MEFVIILVVMPIVIVALVKASSAKSAVKELEYRILDLQRQLDKLKNASSRPEPVAEPAAEPWVQAQPGTELEEEQAKPETDVAEPKLAALDKSRPETLVEPEQKRPEPEPEPLPPEPAPVLDKEEPPEPEPEPSEPAEPPEPPEPAEPVEPFEPEPAEPEPFVPEPVAASVQAESPLPDKMDTESIEMKLGTYWFVRIGVVLVLTGLGILAYYKKQFFIDLSPGAKVGFFYLLSAALGGVGFWLQRNKDNLTNFGQVLVAGGCAGVYFTTYAAHVFEPVKVIANPTVALLLLFSWGGFMIWFADRVKSETIALFATGASYYATYVPLIHVAEVSQWVILLSNLLLGVAAVVFMLRNRWLKMPMLGMVASYAGFFFWRIRVDEPLLQVAVPFIVGVWVIYTSAVFLSRDKSFNDVKRALFLSANNAALFVLLTVDVLALDGERFWILPMAIGSVLLGCALAAARFLKDQPLSRKSYLTQGLVLVTLALMTMKMADSFRGPVLAAESVVMLFMAIRRGSFLLQGASLIVVGIAAVFSLNDAYEGRQDFLLAGLFTGAIFLFNAWLSHYRLGAGKKAVLRLRESYLTVLGFVVGLVAFFTMVQNLESYDWVPAILLATTVLFTGSVYRLKLPEFLLFGQVPAALGLFLSIELAVSAHELTWPLICVFGLTLGQAHWWWWQRDKLLAVFPDPEKIKLFPTVLEAVFSGLFVLQLFAWMSNGLEIERAIWIPAGSLLAIGISSYALVTRALFLGLFSQAFLLVSCLAMIDLCLRKVDLSFFVALVPVATLLLMNLVPLVPKTRIRQLSESFSGLENQLSFAYRSIAAALGLLLIHRFAPTDSIIFVYALVGVVLSLGPGRKLQREWFAWALVYAAFGLLPGLEELMREQAVWQSLSAILSLFVIQQFMRARQNGSSMPELGHQALILIGGASSLFWFSVKVNTSGWAIDGLLTVVWTILAVAYFCIGLVLKEQWYRLVGLGTLAIAVLSVTNEFIGKDAYLGSLLPIAILFVGQQLARRGKSESEVPDWVHQWLILVGGALLFIWLSIKVSQMGGYGLRTIVWTTLAVIYFCIGLGLKERWYRLMGLGILAIALLSLVPIIWQMSTEMKIASFFVMGLVFIGLGFVYTRFKDKINKLL